MLKLSDPLWSKLDTAHSGFDMAKDIQNLLCSWDDKLADWIFWDCLCHQGTVYSATYAAIPHILKLSKQNNSIEQKGQIAAFLALVTFSIFQFESPQSSLEKNLPLPGLPRTLEAWDQKRDVFRSLVKLCSNKKQEKDQLEIYRAELDKPPVTNADLLKIRDMERTFFECLPEIEQLCEHSLHQHLDDADNVKYMLLGMAACRGYVEFANFLEADLHGCRLQCNHCQQQYECGEFGDKIAIYKTGDQQTGPDHPYLDWKKGAPDHADGFIQLTPPKALNTDSYLSYLFELAQKTGQPQPSLLFRVFLGQLDCPKCGKTGPVQIS